jgi:hypothetical protein
MFNALSVQTRKSWEFLCSVFFLETKEFGENYNSQNALLQVSVWFLCCHLYCVHGPHLPRLHPGDIAGMMAGKESTINVL